MPTTTINSAECGCRKGISLMLRAGLEGRPAPDCPHHTGTGPVAHDAEELPAGYRPPTVALNDDEALVALLGMKLARPTDFERNTPHA